MVGVDEILIGEGGRVVDGGFTGSVVVEKVACLDHEIFDYAVDGGVFVAYWSGGGRGLMFSGAELAKVFGCFGALVEERDERERVVS